MRTPSRTRPPRRRPSGRALPLSPMADSMQVSLMCHMHSFGVYSYTRLSCTPTLSPCTMKAVFVDLNKMKVAQLKEELAARDEARTGNKAWLQRRLHGAIVRAFLEARDEEELAEGEEEGVGEGE